jgi:hypothetical protein
VLHDLVNFDLWTCDACFRSINRNKGLVPARDNNKSNPMNFHAALRVTCRIWLALLLVSVAHAQEGHPMSGVWVGDWGLDGAQQKRVVVVLDWMGTKLSGTINPGPNAIPIKTATVDTADWTLHLEADAQNSNGQPVSYVIDGKLDDLGTYNRSLAGSWNVGAEHGTFSITRQ